MRTALRYRSNAPTRRSRRSIANKAPVSSTGLTRCAWPVVSSGSAPGSGSSPPSEPDSTAPWRRRLGAIRLWREDVQAGSIGCGGLPLIVGDHHIGAGAQRGREVQRVEAAEVTAGQQARLPVEGAVGLH